MEERKVLHGSRWQSIGGDITHKVVKTTDNITPKVVKITDAVADEGTSDLLEPEQGEEEMADALNDDFLVDIPDIPMPDEDTKDVDLVKDEVDVAFKLAFIGVGQGGGRIAESFYKLGYRRVCCINTNSQDLSGIDIPLENKLVMDVGHGGAGKDPSKGEAAAKQYHEDIYDIMRRSFGRDFDRILVCIGSGGGTGSGACNHVIDTAHEIASSFKIEGEGKPPSVGVIVSMPKVTEGGKVNANA